MSAKDFEVRAVSKAELARALATIILSRCGHDLEPWIAFVPFRGRLIAIIEEQLEESAKEVERG